MTAYDRLDLLFQQNNGIVKTAQVLQTDFGEGHFAGKDRHAVEKAGPVAA